MPEPIKVKLSRPIEAHGETVTELSLREPTGADLMKCGSPFSIEQRINSVIVHVDAEAVGSLISSCAQIPTSSVRQLSAADFVAAQGALLSFFAEEIPAMSASHTAASAVSSAT